MSVSISANEPLTTTLGVLCEFPAGTAVSHCRRVSGSESGMESSWYDYNDHPVGTLSASRNVFIESDGCTVPSVTKLRFRRTWRAGWHVENDRTCSSGMTVMGLSTGTADTKRVIGNSETANANVFTARKLSDRPVMSCPVITFCLTIADFLNGLSMSVIRRQERPPELNIRLQHETAFRGRAVMVRFHHWLRRSSPHLLIVGTLAITGLSGCRSTRPTAVQFESTSPVHAAPGVAFNESPSTYTATQSGSDSEPPQTVVDQELFLDPPEPPANNSDAGGSASIVNEYDEEVVETLPTITRVPLDGPFPEPVFSNDVPEFEEDVPEFTEFADSVNDLLDNDKSVKGNGGVLSADTADPLDESYLFPADYPKADDTPITSVEDQDSSLPAFEDATGTRESRRPEFLPDSLDDPFTSTLDSTETNPEVPVPNPNPQQSARSIPDTGPVEFLP